MDVDLKKFEVPAEKLRWNCDPNIFDFECTKCLFGGYLSGHSMLCPYSVGGRVLNPTLRATDSSLRSE